MMTNKTFAYFHSPEFSLYDFGPNHAFHPIRQVLTHDLAQSARLLPPEEVHLPEAADESLIALFHRPDYIEAVKAVDADAPQSMTNPRFGLGTSDNPTFANMHHAAAVRVGATVQAVQGVMQGRFEHAANFGGGLHHAHAARASGFCIYNDISVAIAWLRREYDCKIAYIDLDAHHGDGVQWGFYEDPDVLTISIHESGRHLFPGTGGVEEIGEGRARGTSVNIPLLPYTESDNWREALEMVVGDVLEAFRPDIIITQHGCDTHRLDPLTHLSVSVEAMDAATRHLHQLAHELCDGRWIALGGGGYSIWQVVPRAWALVWTALTGRSVPHQIPKEWNAKWHAQAPVPLPEYWYDILDETPMKDAAEFEALWRAEENRKTAAEARALALQYLRQRRKNW